MSAAVAIASKNIVALVNSLPPLDRRVLLLREKQRLSYNQISAALGISCELVSGRIAAARRALLQDLHAPRTPFASFRLLENRST